MSRCDCFKFLLRRERRVRKKKIENIIMIISLVKFNHLQYYMRATMTFGKSGTSDSFQMLVEYLD